MTLIFVGLGFIPMGMGIAQHFRYTALRRRTFATRSAASREPTCHEHAPA